MRIINRLKYYLTLFFWRLIERPRLKKFKNKHQGEDCFIIGNGPSLNKMDLLRLNDYHTFGMNKIYMIFKRVNLNLSYLAAVNNLVIEQSKAEYESMEMPIFLAHNKSKGVIKKRDNVFRLFTKGGQSWSFDSLEDPIFEGMTVTYVALQMAHYMGFKRVFLVGVDHNFVQSGNPHEKQTMKGADMNHFDPNYFAGNEWHLADLKGSEVSYQMADYAFCKTGGKVFDATIDGKLQVFEKIDLEQAFKIAKKK